MKSAICSMIVGAACLGAISLGVGCVVPGEEDVDIVDAHGYHHHGYYDDHHQWHGGWDDEHHVHHDDPNDWHR